MHRRCVKGQIGLRKTKRDGLIQEKRNDPSDVAAESEIELVEKPKFFSLNAIVENVNTEDPEVRLLVVQSARKLLSSGVNRPINEIIGSSVLPMLVSCLESEK